MPAPTPSSTAASNADRELVVTRVVGFPRALVFEAWSDPRHLAEWWGPAGFSNTIAHMDFRVGGEWRYTMHGPDGTDWPNWIRYTEIVPGRRLAYDHGDTPGTPPWFSATVDFADEGAGTRITLRLLFDDPERCAASKAHGAVEGGNQTLGRFEAHLRERAAGTAAATDEVFVFTREIAAPRERVFAAWTDPAHLAHWFGPVGMTLENRAFDLRPGGHYHYGMKSPDGFEMFGLWRFVEIVPPVRLVFEQSFADAAGNRAPAPFPGDWPLWWTTAITFTERDGRTHMVMRATPKDATAAQRRTFKDMQPSMQGGWGATLDALDEYLAIG